MIWLVLYAVVVTALLVLAVVGNADLAEENRRLRGKHLRLVHPATRRTTR